MILFTQTQQQLEEKPLSVLIRVDLDRNLYIYKYRQACNFSFKTSFFRLATTGFSHFFFVTAVPRTVIRIGVAGDHTYRGARPNLKQREPRQRLRQGSPCAEGEETETARKQSDK